MHKRNRRRKKKSSVLSTIILLVAICVFCCSAWQLFTIFSSYKKGNDEYSEIQDLVITIEKKEAEEERVIIDFDKLKEINSDVVAWIRFEEPAIINYPIVHSKDNKEYLTKLFGLGDNSYGTLFVDKNNAGDFSDRNTFIYGHRMKSGSMFGKLEKYADESFCKKYPYFYIYTPDGKETKYQVFSASVVKNTSESYTKNFNSDEEFSKYIEHIKSVSNYPVDVEVGVEDQIVSLSTCTADSNDDRFLVHAVKIK